VGNTAIIVSYISLLIFTVLKEINSLNYLTLLTVRITPGVAGWGEAAAMLDMETTLAEWEDHISCQSWGSVSFTRKKFQAAIAFPLNKIRELVFSTSAP
jgi:precorrin-4 methylase